MMDFTIDGASAYDKFGAIIPKGQRNTFLRYPPRASFRYTDFAESHGIQPDLSVFKAQPRRHSLKLYFRCSGAADFHTKRAAFLNGIGGNWHSYDFGLDHTLQMRYVSHNSTQSFGAVWKPQGWFTLTVTLEEGQFPTFYGSMVGGPGLEPVPVEGIPGGDCEIDGKDLQKFGGIIDGKHSGETALFADVKEPFNDGRSIDLSEIRRKALDLNLHIWLLSKSKQTLLTNWKALYATIARPGLISLNMKERGAASMVFYKDCSNAAAYFGNGWKGINMQLKFTAPSGI